MTIDPVELERLSKAAEQEDDDVRYYGGPTSTHRPARDAYHAALVQLLRTGQLVPAMPSGDASGGGSGLVVGEAMSKTLHNALIASCDSVLPPIPSGDEVEAVAMAICEASGDVWRTGEGMRSPFAAQADRVNNHWRFKATAAITAYEAVSGVAKMREAMKAVNDAETPSSWEAAVDGLIEAARAALGEKP